MSRLSIITPGDLSYPGFNYLWNYCFQVSASFDAIMDMAGGKINIHVLMALAAFASVFMGNFLEGGLLLAMFNLAHIGKYILQASVAKA